MLLSACATTKVSDENKDILIRIRDACQEPVEEAYWLMYSHVPETLEMTSYHVGRKSEWNDEAFALMLEADQISRTIYSKDNTVPTPAFYFFKGALDSYWCMMLRINMNTSARFVSLIYAPFHEPDGSWRDLDGEPGWYYYLEQYV